MGWLARLRRPRRPPAEVVVLTRRGCHLCADMEQVVSRVLGAGTARPAHLRIVDLDDAGREDPALLAHYDTLVPVLLVDGVEVARWVVDERDVRAALGRRRRP
ncbi:glutaredoxin family protein [Ornithinimicrobium avium]|uniref:Glutaredoxin family protein n=1 Tax=Ornithinimicrobium avium TaxID=2283195 RepID=A0A345NQA2_9MICO|nr:glutaredoxin family protein [Ornithinimicrobium avium]AXH97210.1 glutaredoxin family protein [Ornithinimicrobium avium]